MHYRQESDLIRKKITYNYISMVITKNELLDFLYLKNDASKTNEGSMQ